MVTRTINELRAESKTLWHDFDHLCETAARLRAGSYCDDRVVHNALVDGFALCCRKLACFFFAHLPGFPPIKEDDLAASHYVADWNRYRPSPSPDLVEAKRNADRQIAHITSDRRNLNFVPGTEYRWKIDITESELRRTLSLFLQYASAELFDAFALAELQRIQVGEAGHPNAAPPAMGNNTSIQVSFTATTNPPTEVGTICPKPRFGGTTD
jgi:hypothetical protein